MAAYGIGWALSFNVGVRLYGAEIVMFLGLLLLSWSSVLRRYPIAKSVLRAYGLWVVAILISDVVNATAVFDTMRNIATPIFGAGGIVFVACCLARAPMSLLTYFLAVGVAKAILGDPAYGDSLSNLETSWASVAENSNYFKVRIEPALSPLFIFIAILVNRSNPLFAGLFLLAVSVFYFSLDARSAGLIMFAGGLTTIMINSGFRLNRDKILVGVPLVLIFSYVLYAAYVNYSLNSERPGHNARQLEYVQNPYNPISLLLVGRSDWTVMPQAIAERPIFGWGSWAQDDEKRFIYLRASRTGESNMQLGQAGQTFYMPAHSVLGAAWVWSGALGFAAIAWLMVLIWRMIPTLCEPRSLFLPAAAYLTALVLWHVLFSPPQSVRLHFPVALGALIVLSRAVTAARR